MVDRDGGSVSTRLSLNFQETKTQCFHLYVTECLANLVFWPLLLSPYSGRQREKSWALHWRSGTPFIMTVWTLTTLLFTVCPLKHFCFLPDTLTLVSWEITWWNNPSLHCRNWGTNNFKQHAQGWKAINLTLCQVAAFKHQAGMRHTAVTQASQATTLWP